MINNPVRGIFKVTTFKRKAFFLLSDIFIIAFSFYASFWIRFDGNIPAQYVERLPYYFLVAAFIRLSLFYLFGIYDFSWRFFSVLDLVKLTAAIIISSSIFSIIFIIFRQSSYIGAIPRSVLMLDFIITFSMMTSLRISKRVYKEYVNKRAKEEKGKIRVMIIGAGEAGNSIVNEMMRNPKSPYLPVCFVDDDPAKQGLVINGIKVVGKRDKIPEIIKNNHIDEVLIAIPSASSKETRDILNEIRQAGWKKKVSILPGIIDLVNGRISIKDIKDIRIEDLLSREQVTTDFKKISEFINGRCVLVTGAGGSIGSEIVKTLLRFNPLKVVALDIDETELFNLMHRLPKTAIEVRPVVADIRDKAKLENVISQCKPGVIIHSAAYKHVPMLEEFPEEAIKTNVLGTKNLAELAIKYGIEKFINISTDKAINPTSVMGASKRLAEELLKCLNGMNGTRFISVRFGNVLGSRGSVIPLFEEQISKGGPVTITHPEMTRYFMATSEAVILVLQAAAAGQGGEVFVLDMGKPIKIVDLAKEMIRLKGLEPGVDIQIEFTGLRPGEKLFEELLGAEEGSEPTDHPKIFKAKSASKDHDHNEKEFVQLMDKINKLIEISNNNSSKNEIKEILKEILPTYRPDDFGSYQ